MKLARTVAACAVTLAMAFACLGACGCVKADEAGDAPALVRVDAPGWDAETSTPVILIVTEAGGAEALFACAIAANVDAEIALEAGEYEVEVVPPVNADGSTYEALDVLEVAVPSEEDGYALNVTLAPVSAEDVGEERMEGVLDGIARAVAAGDGTLAGDAGRAVVERVAQNASACPAVNKEAVEELASAAEEAGVEDPAAKTSATAPSGTASGGSSSSASSGSGSSTGASGTSSAAGASSSTSHEHSWTAVTEQKWVVDQAAWDEDIYKTNIVCSCGLTWSSTAAWDDHCEASLLAGGSGCRHQSKPIYVETIRHEEVGHYETVTTGYRCSCGAVK